MDGADGGRARGWPGGAGGVQVQGWCSIDPGSQGSISWCALLNSLIDPHQACSLLAFTSVFIYLFPVFLPKQWQ